MSQATVIEALKEKEWMTSAEIAKKLKISRTTITQSLAKLRKYGEVEVLQCKRRKYVPENFYRLKDHW